MRTVTFAKLYRHRLPNGHADYPAGLTMNVSDDVAASAHRAGRLKRDPLDHDGDNKKGGAAPKAD